MKRWQYLSIITIAFLGIIISIWLTHLHLKIVSEPEYESFCNISERINCDKVNSSPYSEILSIPIAHLGSLTYLLVIILALFSLKGHPLSNLLSTFNLIIFIFSNLYSFFLLYVSISIIKSLCILCCGLYIVNLALLIIALFNIKSYFTLNIACPLRDNRLFTIAIIAYILLTLTSSLAIRNLVIDKRNQNRPNQSDKKEIIYKDIDISGSFSMGSHSAPVTIVEISDFECPFCRKAYITLKEAIHRYKDKVRLVFKNFPLSSECNPKVKTNMHPNACYAAYAAVCAGEQNKFWDYVDKLMTGELNKDQYVRYANELGLDIDKFTTCLDSNSARQSIARDIETCVKCQIASVPTIFINGRMLIGARQVQEYIIVIEEELRKAERR
ncbi:MAG: thioredoxin domain-containing protein [Deltaproteobacteria bacterium]|nr:thioredoxin domain-containing protein [Deltaproteobacteria bacterium]